MKKIWHPYLEWECFHAGMYSRKLPTGFDSESARIAYRDFLSDIQRFKNAMGRVLAEWPISCEHFLTNESLNRVAWLGQSSMCIETGISSWYRAGFKLLSDAQAKRANIAAEEYLRKWIVEYDRRDKRVCQDVAQPRLLK